jgi:urate oxidase
MLLEMSSPDVLGYVNSIGGRGVLYLLAVSIILIYPRIRQVEFELPDAIPAE